jgi:enoyl-CoA hydratase/carnithine racemase
MPDKALVVTDLDEADGVATVRMNRPEKKNALSVALLRELVGAIQAVTRNPKVHVLVLDGAGDTFSSGRDLYDLSAGMEKKARWNDESESAIGVVRALRDAPQITIACVEGYCLGGGMVLMNGCDLAVAANDAQIGMPEILRGSYGRSATPTLFHSRIPMKQAFFIQITGHNLSGEEAARIGIVSKSVPLTDLRPYTQALAKEIATRNPVALEHAKIAAYTEVDLPFEQAVHADEAISHRLKYYTNPLPDVEGYLKSQKGGTNVSYRGPKRND